jgi:uncharacterized protein (DUF2141 family)
VPRVERKPLASVSKNCYTLTTQVAEGPALLKKRLESEARMTLKNTFFHQTLAGGIIAWLTFAGVACAQEPTGKLILVLTDFRNDQGLARAALFNASGQKSFPNTAYACQTASGKIDHQKAVLIFNNLPYGTYALSILHDEDLDGVMKKNFLGIPRKGFGFSSRAKPKLGPPSFSDARFLIEQPETTQKIIIYYYGSAPNRVGN